MIKIKGAKAQERIMEEMKMDNKKRNTQCLNCEYSYRGDDSVLHCHKGNTTMVTSFDCEQYVVFMKDKEDLYEMYRIVKTIETENKEVKEDNFVLADKREHIVEGSSAGKGIYFEEDIKTFIKKIKEDTINLSDDKKWFKHVSRGQIINEVLNLIDKRSGNL